MESIPRFLRPPAGSFFLFGPRGTGKSSWARATFGDALWLDLLEPETLRSYSARPERLRELVAAHPRARHVVIDEVQRAPELLSVVHELRERRKELRFVLTGSSARKLRRSAADLLGGRALRCWMHPFMAAELGTRFDLASALKIGLVPLVLGAEDPEATLRAYHSLYLREEIQQEGLVRSVGSFARFLEAISFSHASVLNVSAVARECEVDRRTVVGFVELLEDLMIGTRLPIFTRRAKRAVSAHPKFFFFDAGVFRAARPRGPLDRDSEIQGPALEGLVLQHLRAWNAYRGEPNSIHYWRTRAGVEVDFVVYGPDGLWAIEVKNSRRVHPLDVRGLLAFRDDYRESRPVFLYRGTESLQIEGVACMPVERFLARLRPDRDDLLGASG